MRLKFFSLVVATFFFCFPAFPDTFDTHTLCAVTVAEKGDLEFLYKIRDDIVGRKGDVYKALLTDGQICLLREHDVKVEVLYDEMAAERALFATPGFCSNTAWPCYYTASTFNTANPPSGSLMRHMLDLYNAHPSIVRLYDIGNSEDGAYDIIAMKITDNPDIEEAEPEIRIYGDIHGDEVSGMMVACDVLDWILVNYATDADAQKLVNDGELWFIPQGNPWGLMNQTRYNSNDVDLNRNFWGPDGSSDGSGDFSEAETQAIRDLTEVMGKRFVTSLSFHAGEICFNSVYNYASTPTTDEPIFFESRSGGPEGYADPSPFGLAQAYFDGCTTSGFWYTNGADWYITNGDTNDWSYYQWSDLDTTLEVTTTKWPDSSQIPAYTSQHRQATLNYMLKTFQGVSGLMTDQSSGTPLDGTVTATCTATSSPYVTVPHAYKDVLTDPDIGDFHRVLEPGTYTIECKAAGYPTTTFTGVVVNADQTTTVNCPMCSTNLVYLSSTVNDLCGGVSGDGIVDPGETIELQVTLSNPGTVGATGVSATITSGTSGVTMVDNASAFPDIAGGGTGASIAPHFRFSVGEGVACGTVLSFSIQMTCAQGSWSGAFNLTVGTVVGGGTTTDFSEDFSSGSASGWTFSKTGNGNNWAVTPSYYCGSASGLYYPYNSSYAADAWAFSPGIAMTAGTTYTLGFSQKVQSSTWPEKFEVKCGTAATSSGQTATILPSATYTNTTCTSRAPTFTVPTTGTYYLGFHCTSDADMYYLIIDGIQLTHTGIASCTMHPCSETVEAPEDEVIESSVSAGGFGWSATDAENYRVVRGLRANLAALDTGSADFSCYKWGTNAALSVDISGDDPSSVEGKCFYYIIQGYNGSDPDLYTGPAGNSTAGARQVNTQAACD